MIGAVATAATYSRDDLLEYLNKLAERLERSPRMVDVEQDPEAPSLNQFKTVFGSWNQAKEQAGLETFRKEGQVEPYTDEELLDLLRKLDGETDGPVTQRDMNKKDRYPSAVTYQRRFGSWNKAKTKAGLDTIEEDETRPEYTDEELLAKLREVAEDLDHPVTIRDIEKIDDFPDHATFERRFGSWNKAKVRAGLETVGRGKWTRSPSYSDEELLQKLRNLADEIGGQVAKPDLINAKGYPSPTTYRKRFGSWSHAKNQAGIN